MKDEQIAHAQALCRAANNGDLPEVQRLVESGRAAVAAKRSFRYLYTPLHFACNRGHLEVVQCLVE